MSPLYFPQVNKLPRSRLMDINVITSSRRRPGLRGVNLWMPVKNMPEYLPEVFRGTASDNICRRQRGIKPKDPEKNEFKMIFLRDDFQA